MIDNFFSGFLVGLEYLWRILTADPLVTLIVLPGTIFLISASLVVNILERNRLRKSGMLEVDQMSGKKFEEYLQVLLETRGFNAKITPASGDYGADLVLKKNGTKIVVQAKRYKKNVGIRAVQEIVSARRHYKADECWVITNSDFTEQAKRLALSNDVRLINRRELMNWMLEVSKSA